MFMVLVTLLVNGILNKITQCAYVRIALHVSTKTASHFGLSLERPYLTTDLKLMYFWLKSTESTYLKA